jgi:hypothetical protein
LFRKNYSESVISVGQRIFFSFSPASHIEVGAERPFVLSCIKRNSGRGIIIESLAVVHFQSSVVAIRFAFFITMLMTPSFASTWNSLPGTVTTSIL